MTNTTDALTFDDPRCPRCGSDDEIEYPNYPSTDTAVCDNCGTTFEVH